MWLAVALLALLLAPSTAAAPALDGSYTGTLACPAFPNQEPVRAPMSLTVEGTTATYEVKYDLLGIPERGAGNATPAGKIVVTGGCEGGFSCATEYRGDLSANPIKLTGTQRWWFRSGDRERACEAQLTRVQQ
jgi:hypothetical protein